MDNKIDGHDDVDPVRRYNHLDIRGIAAACSAGGRIV